ncbi:hypothetical protein B0181_09925 [Moraxella caviae]|uniref:Uncharacterized protein n=1 Tax=Moraxella caviae TaxID=34060 RepID=A0A1S9ZW69_9GAMM|nr:hypothetical protein [Moraxella caviae]OOR87700.1 hypothetical protein B0181_09925 [Moraxella caviae]STZ14015.1 Uncharacterised protein [Moraxella caviae]VEW12849.1 Uncharacterised protein [Moraxella caviae]
MKTKTFNCLLKAKDLRETLALLPDDGMALSRDEMIDHITQEYFKTPRNALAWAKFAVGSTWGMTNKQGGKILMMAID